MGAWGRAIMPSLVALQRTLAWPSRKRSMMTPWLPILAWPRTSPVFGSGGGTSKSLPQALLPQALLPQAFPRPSQGRRRQTTQSLPALPSSRASTLQCL